MLAGFYGGWIDRFIIWLINVVWSIPTLLMVIAITLALGRGFWQVFVAVGLTMWVEVARLTRGLVKTVKRRIIYKSRKSFRVFKREINSKSHFAYDNSPINSYFNIKFCKCYFNGKWT